MCPSEYVRTPDIDSGPRGTAQRHEERRCRYIDRSSVQHLRVGRVARWGFLAFLCVVAKIGTMSDPVIFELCTVSVFWDLL